MHIGQICTRSVVTCTSGASALELARLMRDRHVGDLIVVAEHEDGARPVGIVTDRDLVVLVVAKGVDPELLRAEDLVTGDVVTVAESDDVHAAIGAMRSKGVRRLPVVDAHRRLVGVLTADDVARHLAAELTGMASIAEQQVEREYATREPVAHWQRSSSKGGVGKRASAG
ncbi:MAG: CBS domain-containing protein [Proteobacteria bacterium]|nr:CBS domain-containing protein [Pseudomonadota bacterium]